MNLPATSSKDSALVGIADFEICGGCDGAGELPPGEFNGRRYPATPCPACQGDGRQGKRPRKLCANCKGLGVQGRCAACESTGLVQRYRPPKKAFWGVLIGGAGYASLFHLIPGFIDKNYELMAVGVVMTAGAVVLSAAVAAWRHLARD